MSSGLNSTIRQVDHLWSLYQGCNGVTGTLKHVKSSVARSGRIVLRWSSGYGTGGQFLRPGFDPRSRHIFWHPWSSCLLSGPKLQLDSRYKWSNICADYRLSFISKRSLDSRSVTHLKDFEKKTQKCFFFFFFFFFFVQTGTKKDIIIIIK